WNVRAPGMPVLAFNTRNTSGVTGACLMVRRAVFDAVRGFDEQLRVAFNDVDLGRRLTELGYRIVYTPWAELEHAESASRGALHPMDDDRFYTDGCAEPCSARDPYYPSALVMAVPVLRFRICPRANTFPFSPGYCRARTAEGGSMPPVPTGPADRYTLISADCHAGGSHVQ